jgi:hypothetical protein
MRLLNRNKQPLWYANFADKTELIDEWGNSTGQYELTYSNPVKAEWNVNTVDSDYEVEMFGVDAVDTIVMVVRNGDLPLTETSILWYDVTPNIKQDGTTDTPHNYRIIGIRKSLNFAKVYAKKVSVTQVVEQEPIDPEEPEEPIEGDG